MSESSQQAAGKQQKFYAALDEAQRALVVRALLGRDEQRSHIIFNCDLRAIPDKRELTECFRQRDEHYSSIAPISVPFTRPDGSQDTVPVTPAYAQDVEYQTYNTVTVRRKDGATMVVLMRCSDNYVCGVKVYRSEAEKEEARWMIFEGIKLPSSFKHWDETRYSYGHDTGGNTMFGRRSFYNLIDFLLELSADVRQWPTVRGEGFVRVLFMVFGEAQRFRLLRLWAQHTVTSKVELAVPKKMCNLYQKWSVLSKLCLVWYVYLLEAKIANIPLDCVYMSEKEATFRWDESEKILAESLGLNYRNSEKKHSLECFVGKELLLLNSDHVNCLAIIMRELGYQGPIKQFQKELGLPYNGFAGIRGVQPFSAPVPVGAKGEAVGAKAAGDDASSASICSSTHGSQLGLFSNKPAAVGFPVAESDGASPDTSLSASAPLLQLMNDCVTELRGVQPFSADVPVGAQAEASCSFAISPEPQHDHWKASAEIRIPADCSGYDSYGEADEAGYGESSSCDFDYDDDQDGYDDDEEDVMHD